MHKQRILGGFSLVEMMLLLIIVSLMIASGVSVITKKHVKVPRLALHGAYICYYNNDGNLHEEKYVGAGISKKIWDENVDVCRFVPPERASYFYLQAVAGGGAGGAAGYDGIANREVIWSETEVISPFAFTNDLLKLKGISAGELSSYGGTIWAYAKGDGLYGDAGDGGDIYYIKKISGNCFAKESWENPSVEPKRCKDTGSRQTIYYKHWTCKNYYDVDHYYTGSSCSGCSDEACDCECYGYERINECSGGTYSDPCPDADVNSYSSTYWDEDGKYIGYHRYISSSYDYGDCNRCWLYNDWDYSYSYFDEDYPDEATCSTNSQNVTYDNKFDYGVQNPTSTLPPLVLLKKVGTMKDKYGKGKGQDADVREIIRDQSDDYTICNYGNPSTYAGNNGIFGSCFIGYDCNIDCSSTGVQDAFGDGVLVLGNGNTSISRTETFDANWDWYKDVTTEVNGKKYNGVYYDLSEKNGGIGAYGIVCETGVDTNCTGSETDPPSGSDQNRHDSETNTNFQNPYTGTTTTPTKWTPTSCNIGSVSYSSGYNSTPSCTYRSDCDYVWRSKTVRTSDSWECVHDTSLDKGSSCVYGASDLPADQQYAYVIEVATGEEGGKGQKCAFSSGAQANLEYEGISSLLAGIDGSDRNTVGVYKAIFANHEADNWPTWKDQPDMWAQDGTDSEGFATVTLGANQCQLHVERQPKKGRGACVKNNSGSPQGYNGDDYTNCEHDGDHPKDGSFTGSGKGVDPPAGCATGRVGYCLISAVNGMKPFGKYTYKYSWARNNLSYGNAGEPGEYRSMVIRSFKDRDLIVVPGLGGNIGGCTGGDGGDTLIYSVPKGSEVADTENILTDIDGAELMLNVAGGAGGAGCITTPSETLPYHFSAPWPKNGASGGAGKSPDFSLKSNIMGLVLPLDDTVLGKWLSYAGTSGNGGGSQNNCWVSSWERYFEGKKVQGTVGYWTEAEVPCLNDFYDIPPTGGIPGAVLIKW